jgi:DnaK suppressor protein
MAGAFLLRYALPVCEVNEAQVDELRRDLLVLREEIDRLLGLTRDGVRPVDLDEPIGRLTRMDSLQVQSLARASRQGLEVKRRQVLAALDSIAAGDYGLCRRCEEPIGFRRLKVRPETPFCLSCQETLESERR